MKNKHKILCAIISLLVILLIASGILLKNHYQSGGYTYWLGEMDPIEGNIENQYGRLPGVFKNWNGVKIHEFEEWQVYRLFPSGYLEIFHRNQFGDYDRVDLPVSWKRETFPMLIFVFDRRLYVVSYDVVRNVPSGRRLSISQPGFDLFEIDHEKKDPLRLLANGLDLGAGIDSLIYGRMTPSTISVCGENKCADIGRNGGIKYWSLDALKNYEFIEVVFDVDSSVAIVREKWDDRIDGPINQKKSDFSLAFLSQQGVRMVPIDDIGIPFSLSLKDGKPIWRIAKTQRELQDLFLFEINRMRNRGMIDYGENNLEGRVAWSQIYYLNGLITAASNDFNFLDKDLKILFRDRVKAEVELIARLADGDYPGYRVKRYSIDREPLLFALHLGRVAQLLSRASEQSMASSSVDEVLNRIKHELLQLDRTVEYLDNCPNDDFGTEDCMTLFYRQGIPFWADGINVPYNYISGYVGGLIAIDKNPRNFNLLSKLMLPIRNEEGIHNLPSTWRYWWGNGQKGWSYGDLISLNTPAWPGNAAGNDLAHITYRSMDAATLILLYNSNNFNTTEREVIHFKRLVEYGWLLPQVNEQLYLMNHRASLNPVVAKRFSRSSQAWQIQSQVWALSDIAFQSQ
jgi:hypothetical protein